jgi:hypothetical protein
MFWQMLGKHNMQFSSNEGGPPDDSSIIPSNPHEYSGYIPDYSYFNNIPHRPIMLFFQRATRQSFLAHNTAISVY